MRIVMTGGTSGIGLEAVKRLVSPDRHVLIGARNPVKAPTTVREAARLEPLDLADLTSVEAFCAARRNEPEIDALVLNAGGQDVTGARSAQGLELTFAANHLAHQLILMRLVDRIAPGGRVLLTSSGTHDPQMKTGIPAPRHADARRLARPETDPERDQSAGTAGRRAYSSSKLCNVMAARELARRLAATRPDVAVMAYDPGFTPGTGLARSYGAAASFVFRRILPLLVRGERSSTPENSGRLLAELITAPEHGARRGAYMAVRGRRVLDIPPSLLARDDAARAKLWADSEALIAEAGFGGP